MNLGKTSFFEQAKCSLAAIFLSLLEGMFCEKTSIFQYINANMPCSARGLGEQVVRSLIGHGACVSVSILPSAYIHSHDNFCM